jgi:glycosyltransferase involved in cell wall biosynthesis
MSEAKGGYYVLQLAKALENEKIRFILVGVDEECQINALNVNIQQPVYDKSLIAEYYSLADLFVICSKRENYPTTCLEAQCCGTPVIGFDTGGAKETDISGLGLFTEYQNTDLLCSNIKEILYHTELDRSLLAERAGSVFSSQSMCKNYYKLYQKAVCQDEE